MVWKVEEVLVDVFALLRGVGYAVYYSRLVPLLVGGNLI